MMQRPLYHLSIIPTPRQLQRLLHYHKEAGAQPDTRYKICINNDNVQEYNAKFREKNLRSIKLSKEL